jgi:hypothetical protein
MPAGAANEDIAMKRCAVGRCALAERKATRWRKDPCVEAIEILEARQV